MQCRLGGMKDVPNTGRPATCYCEMTRFGNLKGMANSANVGCASWAFQDNGENMRALGKLDIPTTFSGTGHGHSPTEG
jgi:hypothetical protein